MNPGGYIGFFDPALGDHETFAPQGDATAVARFKAKATAQEARREFGIAMPQPGRRSVGWR